MQWRLSYGRFGLTRQILQEMYDSQGGVCAICLGDGASKMGLVLDHDHKTNKARALLCHNCNVGLGNFKDDPALLESAERYLKKYKKL